MTGMKTARMTGRVLAAGVGLSAAAYAALAAMTYQRYGRTAAPAGHELIDRFIPAPEIEERHAIRVAANAADVFDAACRVDVGDSALVRGIFQARELVLGAEPEPRDAEGGPRGLVAQAKSIGWGVLAEIPGQEIVFGAVTQPWVAHPVFRALPPAEFAAFDEPGYVKIAWTLRADQVDGRMSMARTVTRAATTDVRSRRLFRRYWAGVMPGVVVIRHVMLRQIKKNAEDARKF